MQTAIQHDIGIAESHDISCAGFVEVGVNPGTHQPADRELIAADIAGDIRDHAHGASHHRSIVRALGGILGVQNTQPAKCECAYASGDNCASRN